MDNFKIIAVTRPDFYFGESEEINSILSNGEAHYVHIRKPGSSIQEMINLIEHIKPEFISNLKLHDHFSLVETYNLGGIHLNSRNPISNPKAKTVSVSIHTLEEIENIRDYDYYFISPIFDSFSKQGYKAKFDLNKLSDRIKDTKAIALGGVIPPRFPLLKSLGFKGAALLSYFFPTNKFN